MRPLWYSRPIKQSSASIFKKKTIRQYQRQQLFPSPKTMGLPRVLLWGLFCSWCTLHSVNCIPRLFADDTCLVFSAPFPSQLSSIMNGGLVNISKWLNSNKLTVNPSKFNAPIIPPNVISPHPRLISH